LFRARNKSAWRIFGVVSARLLSDPRGAVRILVVDDEYECGVLLSRFLRRLGHEPLVALDPEDALAMLDDEVSAVVTDIDMPGMNGVELAKEILARHGDMPITFCTGSDPEGDLAQGAARIGPVVSKVRTMDAARTVVALATARAGVFDKSA